ncbi:hypothetical protein [Cryptosporangium arvum]|uniref:Uncharacterized protein n=1 Tax=Cryptosporangium arvum DSM 44712 TaxID=927661 RepID=A0A011AF30_9ACTN|nr:hypothetical protein [Cryptosporangium arvum]EXG80641.1 hypothetical protein CryarDRAFT_1725 [Cryptosporangium arvum DSM 44712]
MPRYVSQLDPRGPFDGLPDVRRLLVLRGARRAGWPAPRSPGRLARYRAAVGAVSSRTLRQ